VELPSGKIRVLGCLAGLIVGAILGALVGMAFNNVVSFAAIGACVGLVLEFCFPRAAGYMFDGFINPL
jgi:hypothetical protein